MPQDYNNTLNLPQSEFSMRAGLPQKEPVMLEKWKESKLYENLMIKNEGKPLFVLHDGPPFANGDIHLGTALNKILKDFIVRYKNMSGFKSPYIPGWDTHGLPIELKAMKKIGLKKESLTPLEIRKHCKEFALMYMENQKQQFIRLGVVGDWANPYLTLKPEYEATQIKIFGEMAKKGYIYKGLKPVYWCPHDETALAEAEIEYSDDKCDSIFVKFEVKDDKGKLQALGADITKTYFVIWTTTTWTLPGNVAICVGPNYLYSLVKANGECYIIASELVESTMKAAGIDEYQLSGEIKGKDLEYMVAHHPFLDRDSLIINGDHVTLESGTGSVHTAPGHGIEDFEVCRNYPEIEIIVPVDSKGYLTADAGQFKGLLYSDANKVILEHLKSINALFAVQRIVHPYPHCWRCNTPILFRATEQWFCSIKGFREQVLDAIGEVDWIPAWGEERIAGMVSDRSDWCISRQRNWGVPFPIFYCKECNKPIINDQTINKISELVTREGTDAWLKYDASEIIPEGLKCPDCDCGDFTKETDTMDGWFDSGVSHAAVLETRKELKWPADLYLEGNDQYRGWFQSSLLTAVATKGKAPYKAVLTHGWVVDGEGRKMSKSLGNGIDPSDIIKEYGADILRLWVASSNYQTDVRISKDILKQLSEIYRKIRNTAKYILGNLYDYSPDTDAVPFNEVFELDKWALYKLDSLNAKVRQAYDNYEFHIIFHAIHNFCAVDMSNFYLDIIKDRLYVEKNNSKARRSAQTTIYKILNDLTRMIAPILAFTAEEIWQHIPKSKDMDEKSILFNEMPQQTGINVDIKFEEKWAKIFAIRSDVNKALEIARANKLIGKPLDANVTLFCDDETAKFIESIKEDLKALFIVSSVNIQTGVAVGEFKGDIEGLSVTIIQAEGEKCERCWIYSKTIGEDSEHPTLCSRCSKTV
jgi:isoleucyl-tRNA synthetase